MTRTILCALLAITVSSLSTACGGDDGGAELCEAVCEEQTMAGCQPFASLEQCVALCQGYEGIGGDCLAGGEVYWQCQLDLADVCDVQGCQAEGMAFTDACAAP